MAMVRRLILLALLAAASAQAPVQAMVCNSEIRDPQRGRTIAVRLTTPDALASPVPLVMWSPGLGGGLDSGGLYAAAWARAGVATLQFRHPGSGPEVYREAAALAKAAAVSGSTPEAASAGRAARAARIREGSSGAQVAARVADIELALSRLADGLGSCRTSMIDRGRLGIAGHSMGAWVAQIYAGQLLPGVAPLQRPPFKAALAASGSPLVRADALAASTAGMAIPFMLITGTLDGIPESAPPARAEAMLAERMGLWPHLPAGEKYLFVAAGATHNQLAGTATPPALSARLLPVTTGFWMNTLLGGAVPAPPSAGDRFETK